LREIGKDAAGPEPEEQVDAPQGGQDRSQPGQEQRRGGGGRVGKNPGFFKKKKPAQFQWVFLGFLGFFDFYMVFLYICPEERVFRFFF
jgi:hypothetical protein